MWVLTCTVVGQPAQQRNVAPPDGDEMFAFMLPTGNYEIQASLDMVTGTVSTPAGDDDVNPVYVT
jgi:hypothetical protein